jgi:hypothetical protein
MPVIGRDYSDDGLYEMRRYIDRVELGHRPLFTAYRLINLNNVNVQDGRLLREKVEALGKTVRQEERLMNELREAVLRTIRDQTSYISG